MKTWDFITSLGMLAFIGRGALMVTEARSKPTKEETDLARALILAEARRQGVDPAVALAFARVESGFDARLEGDLGWHRDRERYEKRVPKTSPYRDIPDLWHSYGLFQLLAPFHVQGDEHPKELLDPRINAHRGVRRIKRLLQKYGGDLTKARLAYVFGTLPPDDHPRRAEVLRRFAAALAAERSA